MGKVHYFNEIEYPTQLESYIYVNLTSYKKPDLPQNSTSSYFQYIINKKKSIIRLSLLT